MPGTSETIEPIESDGLRRRSTARLVARVAGWTTLGLVVVSTVYLAVLAVQWNARVDELRADRRDLTTSLSDANTAYHASSETLRSTLGNRQAAEDTFVALVNDKAQAEDFSYRFLDAAQGLRECSEAEADAVRMLRLAHWDQSYWWDVPRWVDDWCWSLEDYLDEIDAEYKEAFP
jgi:hypothetical protein